MRNSYNISNSERVRVIDSPVKNPSPSTIVTEKSSGAEGTGLTYRAISPSFLLGSLLTFACFDVL